MGFFAKLKRANSKDLAGWVEGSITHLKRGARQFSVENGKVVLWIVGEDDIVLEPSQVETFELATTDIRKQYGNNIMVCDAYLIVLKNGESGTMTIFKGKIADVKLALRK
ncbi:hypothetical protein J6Y73_05435 [bacterium]|nr:hypothetical protein [bacterium]